MNHLFHNNPGMKWFIVSMTILSMSSYADCQEMQYTVAQNVPLLTQKNELRLSATTGTETFGFQGAYAFTNALAVTGSYSDGLGFDIRNRNSWEFAIGYFKSDESSPFEIYFGAERYYRNFTVLSDPHPGAIPSNVFVTNIFRTNCTIPFVQLDAFTYRIDNQHFTGSIKIGYVMYDHFSDTNFGTNGTPNTNKTNPGGAPFFEPCITYRLGLHKFSFLAQTGLTFLTPVTNYDSPISFFINIGLSLRLFGAEKKDMK